MSHCIFATEADAAAYCATAYADWIASHPGEEYRAQTTEWATPAQRLTDSKWVVPACPATDNTGQTIEQSDPSWYPDPGFP